MEWESTSPELPTLHNTVESYLEINKSFLMNKNKNLPDYGKLLLYHVKHMFFYKSSWLQDANVCSSALNPFDPTQLNTVTTSFYLHYLLFGCCFFFIKENRLICHQTILFQANSNAENSRLVVAVLCAALYPNVVQVMTPESKYSKTSAGAVPKAPKPTDIRFKTKEEGYVSFVHYIIFVKIVWH